VISSPSTYGDVQKELIAEVHRTSLWPVLFTVDGDTTNPDQTDVIHRDGSCIILVPDGNLQSLKAVISGLILDRHKHIKSVWNSEAQFVVAGIKEF
jgi:hypothetical protein